MLLYAFIGLVLVLGVAFWRRKRDKYADVCVAVALPITLLLLKPFGLLSGWLRPVTVDGALRSLDLALHLDGFALTRLCIAHPWSLLVLQFVYEALPLALALAWVLTRSNVLLRACVLGVPLAFVFYMLVPAVGPAFAYPSWPLDGASIQPAIAFPRNCVPSMHLTWALLLAVNTRGAWRWGFGLYSALMALAVVVSGQHYAVDALAALPFTWAVQWASCLKLAWIRQVRTV